MKKTVTKLIFVITSVLAPIFFAGASYEAWQVTNLESSSATFRIEISGFKSEEESDVNADTYATFYVRNDTGTPAYNKEYPSITKISGYGDNDPSNDVVYATATAMLMAPDSNYIIYMSTNNNSYRSSDYKFTTTSATISPNKVKISSFSPTEGNVGDTITINGDNLKDTTFVLFGGGEASPLSDSKSSTQIKVKVPSNATTGLLTVKTENNGTTVSSGTFTIISNSSTTSSNKKNETDLSSKGGGLVPDCPETGCGFNEVMTLVNNVIKFLLFTIATPLIAIILMYLGYTYLTAGGDSGKIEKVKTILFNAVIGYVIALAAWLIVNTIIKALNLDPSINTFL